MCPASRDARLITDPNDHLPERASLRLDLPSLSALTNQLVSQAMGYEVYIVLCPVLPRSGLPGMSSVRDLTSAIKRQLFVGSIDASVPCFPSLLHCYDPLSLRRPPCRRIIFG